MSEQSWTRLQGRTITRRTMLRWSARAGVGVAGIALVGCGDDDDDDVAPTAAATEQADEEQAQAEEEEEEEEEEAPPAPAVPAPPVVVEAVALGGNDGAVVLRNRSDADVDLSGWFICQFPNYWPMPPLVLSAGAAVTAHVGMGEGTDTDLFANGAYGPLGETGEIGIYSSGAFDTPDAMVTYISWGNGGERISVAAAARLWSGPSLQAAAGDALLRTGDGNDAGAFTIEAGGAAAFASASFEPEGVAIVEVGVGGADSSVVLQNFSDAPVSLAGWFLCNVPAYWPLPADVELAPGGTVFIEFNAGGSAPINAGGGLGELTGSGAGEIALYNAPEFGSSDAIVSYVGWNGGRGRKDEAQGAGIWGTEDVAASDGSIIVFTGAGEGAAGYEAR
ncbi:MAG: hypothetical protein DK306_001160 [Chloroflexi bacterium]|nr:MAG: hypothetical protein DK306_001160 [Chloroflexota bacterium]